MKVANCYSRQKKETWFKNQSVIFEPGFDLVNSDTKAAPSTTDHNILKLLAKFNALVFRLSVRTRSAAYALIAQENLLLDHSR
jgi:hypothetical protein